MGIIREEQTKMLIREAEKAKSEGRSLSKVFDLVAEKTGRKKGSVRNEYYSVLKRAGTDAEFAKKMGVKKLKTEKIIEFEKAEARSLVKKILVGATFGKSVRRTISEMTSDAKTALRYQNKYRNMIRYCRSEVEGIVEEIERTYGKTYDPYAKVGRDELFEKLKSEINGLYARICERTKRENERLKTAVSEMKAENERLKAAVARYEGTNKSLKNYFENALLGEFRRGGD